MANHWAENISIRRQAIGMYQWISHGDDGKEPSSPINRRTVIRYKNPFIF